MQVKITEAELFAAIDNAVAGHMRRDPAVRSKTCKPILVAPAGKIASINGMPLAPVCPKSQLVANWGIDAIMGGTGC